MTEEVLYSWNDLVQLFGSDRLVHEAIRRGSVEMIYSPNAEPSFRLLPGASPPKPEANETQGDRSGASVPSAVIGEEDLPDAPAPSLELPPGGTTGRASYLYLNDHDVYVIRLKDRLLRIAGDDVREMRRMYSNFDGDPQSINAICAQFGLDRATGMRILRAMGVTHDSPPQTDEEIASMGATLQSAQAAGVAQVQAWKQTMKAHSLREQERINRRDARKWRHLEQSVRDLVSSEIDRLEDADPGPATYTMPPLHTAERRFALVCSPTDLHFGCYGPADTTDGQGYSSKMAEERLHTCADRVLERVSILGQPEVVYVGVGSDWFHTDNIHYQTSRGTQQQVDRSMAGMIREGTELFCDYVDRIRAIGSKVTLVLMRGNHDQLSSHWLQLYCERHYRDVPEVTVHSGEAERLGVRYGRNLLFFSHGYSQKIRQLVDTLTQEGRGHMSQTDWSYVFVGDKHHERWWDMGGTTILQMPTLAGPTEWLAQKGYTTSRKALAGYVLSHDEGMTDAFWANVRVPSFSNIVETHQ